MREHCEVNRILQWYLCGCACVNLSGRKKRRDGGSEDDKESMKHSDDPHQFHRAVLRTPGPLPLTPTMVQ